MNVTAVVFDIPKQDSFDLWLWKQFDYPWTYHLGALEVWFQNMLASEHKYKARL